LCYRATLEAIANAAARLTEPSDHSHLLTFYM
jgi:hypothetical protein